MESGQALDGPAETLIQKIDIVVTALLSGGKVIWSWKNQSGGDPGKIKIDKGVNGRLVFKIDNQTDKAIRFDASGPIFYLANPKPGDYPTSFPKDGDLLVESCDANQLSLIDFNTVEGEIMYQVNFVTDTGGPVHPLDPIIMNGGGGIKGFF